MEYTELLKCIAAPERLRILNLLDEGPLCVCHIQDLLDAPQVKISKHLATMKQIGLIESSREGTWMVYRLSEPVSGLLKANLEHLREIDEPIANDLSKDLKARGQLIKKLCKSTSDCPETLREEIACC